MADLINVDPPHVQALDKACEAPVASRQKLISNRDDNAAIGCVQRLSASGDVRDRGVVRSDEVDKTAKQVAVEKRQVSGHHKSDIMLARQESAYETAQRSVAGASVLNTAVAGILSADNNSLIGNGVDDVENALQDRDAVKRQQELVPTHTAALTPGQDDSRHHGFVLCHGGFLEQAGRQHVRRDVSTAYHRGHFCTTEAGSI